MVDTSSGFLRSERIARAVEREEENARDWIFGEIHRSQGTKKKSRAFAHAVTYCFCRATATTPFKWRFKSSRIKKNIGNHYRTHIHTDIMYVQAIYYHPDHHCARMKKIQ
jgi:hypothetical protein